MKADLTIALAGNPNSGKTTLFNAVTGARQHVGNYPGITVEKKEGFASLDDVSFHLVDLPGTYSLTAYSQEELVARNFLAEDRPDAVIDVLNAGALERNLYLAVQLMELGVPVVLALNMMDEAEKKGLRIDAEKLSELIGAPAAPCVARSGRGLTRLLAATRSLAEEEKGREWRPLSISYGPDLDPVLKEMVELIEAENFLTDRYPARWTALKYLESDEEIRVMGRKAGKLAKTLESMAQKVGEHCQATLDTYPEAIIADYRYGFISSIIRQGVIRREPLRSERIAMSDRLDKVLTHKFLGPLIMFGVLFSVYQITFTLGDTPMGWLESFFSWLGETVHALMPEGLLRSLVVSGVIDGVGGVLSFVPLIMIIFFLIAFLEDSGYMARIAYMLDRVFRIFGLHGCSVMPFIVSGGVGGGCAVPGVMATRTLRSRREKLATLLTAPFMTCGAKLPVFILLTGVLFPGEQPLALFSITLFAWAMALIVAKLLRSTVIRGPSTPFVMELPPYRMPTCRGMCIHTWERTWQYIKKAGTVILAISILLWAGMTFPRPEGERFAELERRAAALESTLAGAEREQADMIGQKLESIRAEMTQTALSHSAAGRLGIFFEPLTRLAGFDWRTNISLIGGFAAKEVIVSTLGTAYSLGQVDPEESGGLRKIIAQDPEWTVQRGLALIVFILLYAPCFVTVAAIRHEAGSWKWALFSTGFNTLFAFGLAAAVFQFGNLVG